MRYRGELTLQDIDLIAQIVRSEENYRGVLYLDPESRGLHEDVLRAIAERGIIKVVSEIREAASFNPLTYELIERYRSVPAIPQRDLLKAILGRTSGTAYDAWLVAASRAERMICGIRDNKGHQGTGFLIADDLILTALHVFRQCTDKSAIRLVFDQLTYLGCNLDPGIEVKLANVSLDHANAKLEPLDVVVLKADQSLGTMKIGTSSEQRSWFFLPDLAATAIAPNDIVSLLHRPSAASFYVAFGSFGEATKTGESFVYDADSDPGSSGAPVVSAQTWDILGLHVAELPQKPPNRQAITGEVIRRIIEGEERILLPTPPVVLLRK